MSEKEIGKGTAARQGAVNDLLYQDRLTQLEW
jgi:hypothetical protein